MNRIQTEPNTNRTKLTMIYFSWKNIRTKLTNRTEPKSNQKNNWSVHPYFLSLSTKLISFFFGYFTNNPPSITWYYPSNQNQRHLQNFRSLIHINPKLFRIFSFRAFQATHFNHHKLDTSHSLFMSHLQKTRRILQLPVKLSCAWQLPSYMIINNQVSYLHTCDDFTIHHDYFFQLNNPYSLQWLLWSPPHLIFIFW